MNGIGAEANKSWLVKVTAAWLTAFIEVKRRTTDRFGRPAEAVTPQKRLHILRTAMVYIQENDLADRPVRFDVIEVIQGEVHHIEGAFDATEMA